MQPDYLLEKQNKIQEEAQKVLEKLGLIDLLKKYGEPEIIGSMALGLMTWRDIDIEVIVKKLKREDLAEVIAKVVKLPTKRMDFAVTDNRSRYGMHEKIPNSLYIGMKYFDDDVPNELLLGSNPLAWKIDIHFLLKENARGRKVTQELKDKITDEKRKIILEIKDVVAKSPKHRKEIFSMDIYKAVLDEGIISFAEFKEYLAKTNRTLY